MTNAWGPSWGKQLPGERPRETADTRALSPAGMFGEKAPLRLAAQEQTARAMSAYDVHSTRQKPVCKRSRSVNARNFASVTPAKIFGRGHYRAQGRLLRHAGNSVVVTSCIYIMGATCGYHFLFISKRARLETPLDTFFPRPGLCLHASLPLNVPLSPRRKTKERRTHRHRYAAVHCSSRRPLHGSPTNHSF
jgi:hypothetical protein